MRLTALLLLNLAILSGSHAGQDLTIAVPAATAFVARIDLQKMRHSVMATEIIDQNLEKYNSMVATAETATGLKMDKVERLWLLAEKSDHGVIVLEGAIDVEGLRAQAGKKANMVFTARSGFDLYGEFKEGEKEMVLAANARMVAVGNRAYSATFLNLLANSQAAAPAVDEILNLLKEPGAAVPGSDKILAAMREDTGTAVFAILQINDEMKAQNRDLANMVSQALLSVTVNETVAAKLRLDTLSPDQAEALMMIANGMIAMQNVQLAQMNANTAEYPADKIRQANVVTSLLKTMKMQQAGATINCDWVLSDDAYRLIKESAAVKKGAAATGIAVP